MQSKGKWGGKMKFQKPVERCHAGQQVTEVPQVGERERRKKIYLKK